MKINVMLGHCVLNQKFLVWKNIFETMHRPICFVCNLFITKKNKKRRPTMNHHFPVYIRNKNLLFAPQLLFLMMCQNIFSSFHN